MRILGISGSLRSGSHNTRLLRAAAAALPSGVQLELWDGLRELPPYDADLDVEPAEPAVAGLRRAIEEADGVLIATPEFNGSLPGALKNALDWASRPFPENSLRGKPVAVIGASTGLFGAAWAQAEARKVLGVIGADVIDAELPIGQADSAFGADGELLDPEARAVLSELVGVLAERAGAAEATAAHDSGEATAAHDSSEAAAAKGAGELTAADDAGEATAADDAGEATAPESAGGAANDGVDAAAANYGVHASARATGPVMAAAGDAAIAGRPGAPNAAVGDGAGLPNTGTGDGTGAAHIAARGSAGVATPATV